VDRHASIYVQGVDITTAVDDEQPAIASQTKTPRRRLMCRPLHTQVVVWLRA